MTVERIAIADVRVTERRRQDLGDIAALARNIDQHGLLHPIIIAADNELIAGERRLRACQHLGETTIDVRRLSDLSNEERRELELAENLNRKDLTSFEQARDMVSRAEVAAETLREEAANSCRNSDKKSGRGRPVKADSEASVASHLGISRPQLNEHKVHVVTAEAYPALQKPEWKQYHVLEAKERLEALPEPERADAVKLIDQPGIPPKDAIGIIGNLASMAPEERGEIFRLAESDDSRERTRALTKAAERPPMPDPRSTMLRGVVRELKKAAREFPEDPLSPRIEALIDPVMAVIAALDAAYQEIKRADAVSRKVS